MDKNIKVDSLEKKNIDYQFVAVPLNLFYCLDNNIRSMLFTLIQMSTYKESEAIDKGKKWDGWFLAANCVLAANTNLSENLVRATLDALYQKGIISILSEGKAKGQNTPPNRIIIHWERFKDYEKESIQDCIENPMLAISTPKYKGSNYRPSYLDKKDDVVTTEIVMVEDEVNSKVDDLVTDLVKSEDNINNIENKNNKENKDNISNNTNIIYNDSSFEGKEESLSIGEYQLNELIKGFSKVKDEDSLIEQFQKVIERLGRYPKETQEKYSGGINSAIEKRCSEIGIDSNILLDYYNV